MEANIRWRLIYKMEANIRWRLIYKMEANIRWRLIYKMAANIQDGGLYIKWKHYIIQDRSYYIQDMETLSVRKNFIHLIKLKTSKC